MLLKREILSPILLYEHKFGTKAAAVARKEYAPRLETLNRTGDTKVIQLIDFCPERRASSASPVMVVHQPTTKSS